MTRSAHLALPANHRQQVLTILAANLPRDATVWVFGSRATGRARRYSDLDLAIDAGRPLTLDGSQGSPKHTAKVNCPTGSILSIGKASTIASGR
jgi:predicted nucleotidyltransferase